MMRPAASAVAAFVAAVLVLCCITEASNTEISTPEAFKAFFDENNWDQNITLTADIDFSHTNISFPLGVTDGNNCTEYTGTLDGQWHTIKGIKVSNGKSDAGIFCSLSGATIKNLVIDSSCSFAGSKAGSLSVNVLGDITVMNVVSRANVTGTTLAGGLIANVTWWTEDSRTLLIKNCTRDGNTSSTEVAGGFIAWFSTNNGYYTAVISYSRSNGMVKAMSEAGGFIGFTEPCKSTVEISDCTSECAIDMKSTPDVTRYYDHFGGFIGHVKLCKLAELTITDSTRNGMISYNHHNAVPYLGGFIGAVTDTAEDKSDVIFRNCVSDGEIRNGDGHSGGFIGDVVFQENTEVSFTNCLSKANISATGRVAGFAYNSESAIYLERCVSKGSLQGLLVYGFALIVQKATKVVAMGMLEQTTGSATAHWERGTFCDSLYSIKGDCNTRCAIENSTGVYHIENNEPQKLLNTLLTEQDGTLWTDHLDLVHLVTVSVGSPCSNTSQVIRGSTLAENSDIFCIPLDSFIAFNRSTREKISSNTRFYSDTDLAIFHSVTLHGAINSTVVVEHNETLGTSSVLQPFFNSEFIIRDENTPATVYSSSFAVVQNMKLIVRRVSRVETVIDPDGKELDDETIRRETESLIEGSGSTVSDITVIRKEDGLIYVTAIVPEDQAESIADKLGECVKP